MARKRVLTAGEKLNLALAMVSYLGEHDFSSVKELAIRFGVTENEIMSVLKMVWVSERNGDSLFDFDFDLDNPDEVALGFRQAFTGMPKLSSQQVVALQAGLTKLASLPGVADRDEIDALMVLLGGSAAESVSNIIHITPSSLDSEMLVVTQAIVLKKRIRFEYLSTLNERSTRDFDPIHLTSVGEDWIVRGYCHLKQSERNFRIDRMHHTQMLEVPISSEALALEISQSLYQPNPDDTVVTFEIAPEALKLLDDFIQDSEPEELPNGHFRFVAPIGDLEVLGPVVARYGGAARVIAPAPAVSAVVQYASAALGLVRSDSTALIEE